MTGVGAALIDLVLPRACVGCGLPAATLCAACRGDTAPFRVPVDDVDVVAATTYGAGVRRAIIAYKERGRRDLAAVLGLLLATALGDLLARTSVPVLLVAPPSARAVAAGRGGDHVLRLARAAMRAGHGPAPPLRVAAGLVRSTRPVRDSAGLGVAERERNLAGSMTASAPRGPGRRTSVVIVDDIVTTGATLRETTRALRLAGWPVLGAAVVAATPRRLTADPLAGHGRAV